VTGATELADALARRAGDEVERLVDRHLPGFRVPGVFAGHPVGPDVRADLAFTLGLLRRYGATEVAGVAVEDALRRVLHPIDGAATHTFSSYRVAETLADLGPFDVNPLFDAGSPAERDRLAAACDSTSFVPLLEEGHLPRNYAAVLARCELARVRLGLPVDLPALDALLDRVRALLGEHPRGFLDDSASGIGRYDIYTPDVYLFSEPFAHRLGEVWERGARSALGLVGAVVASNGAAVPWGRSSGALATCMTIELAGLALDHGLTPEPGRWLALAERALERIDDWFAGGLVTAHQHRSTYAYRGSHRRLQMTLDCLGKLVDAALGLRRAGRRGGHAPLGEVFPARDELVVVDDARRAGVWSYRSTDLAFVLPLVGGTVSDYLPSPRNPGLFEVPVDADLPTGVPSVYAGGRHFTAGGLPAAVEKRPCGLVVRHDGFAVSGSLEARDGGRELPGSREATYRVEGRTLHVEETLRFETAPDAVAVQVTEAAARPLSVRFRCATPHAATVVDTAGLKEYRSFWGELARVHQLDLDPLPTLSYGWSVAAKLRVLTSAVSHHYHRSLYDALAERVVDGAVPRSALADQRRLGRVLGQWDLFHLHWPEWFLGPELDRHRAFIDALGRSGVRVVWTQHNFGPHEGDDRLTAVYDAWAAAADGVVHHSRWGQERVRARYAFSPDAVHRVVPHGHFGNLMGDVPAVDRREVEDELGLTPGLLRLGVVGAPRPDKDVALVVDAFLACGRDDLELLVLSLGPDDPVPSHPRIVARPYRMEPRWLYNRRLRAIDVLVLPFRGESMLTTGVVGDAVGLGLPTLVSDWPFLTEVLGGAGICYGRTADDLAQQLRRLDEAALADAAAACRALQPAYDWSVVAERTFELLEAVGTSRL
jgi:glycosyltransferase involved in cell wall biosynthesis